MFSGLLVDGAGATWVALGFAGVGHFDGGGWFGHGVPCPF